jgi:hypothetical protein
MGNLYYILNDIVVPALWGHVNVHGIKLTQIELIPMEANCAIVIIWLMGSVMIWP